MLTLSVTSLISPSPLDLFPLSGTHPLLFRFPNPFLPLPSPLIIGPSLLSLISKLLEKHMHSILYDFCISNDLISPFQFGFLPHRPTTSSLLFSSHSILSLLESHTSVCGTFLDLRKAFDSVPQQTLIHLLASSNLPFPLLQWLHSFLLNRSQKVVLNGTSSSPLLVTSGVPQCSILGPLLFIIYINGITHLSFSPQTHLILFADDIFVFKLIASSTDMSNFQCDLDSISSWLTSHLLQLILLNPSTCSSPTNLLLTSTPFPPLNLSHPHRMSFLLPLPWHPFLTILLLGSLYCCYLQQSPKGSRPRVPPLLF